MRILFALLLTALPLVAQNFSVRLWRTMPTNSQEVIDGIPLDSPAWSLTTNIGTNTAVTPPWVLMTKATLEDCVATNRSAFYGYLAAISAASQSIQNTNRLLIAGRPLRAGTQIVTPGQTNYSITFDWPMPDATYIVIFDRRKSAGFAVDLNKTTNGFLLNISQPSTANVGWLAVQINAP